MKRSHLSFLSYPVMEVERGANLMVAASLPLAVLVYALLTEVVVGVLSKAVTSQHNHQQNSASNMEVERNAHMQVVKR